MKVEKSKLKKILSKIGTCVGKMPNESIVAFQNNEGVLKITATDLKNIVTATTEGEMDTLEFVIDYKSLMNVCKFRGKEISFIKEDKKLIVSDDNTKMEYAVDNIDTFSFAKNEMEDNYIEINTKDFQKVVHDGSFVRMLNDARAFTTGVEVSIKDGKLVALSTDCKRLARSEKEVENKEAEFSSVFSGKCIEAIKTFESETIRIRMNDKVVNFQMDGYDFYMKKLDCKFPDTGKFFSEEEGSQYFVKRNDLLESLNLLSVVDNEVVDVECKDGQVKMISKGASNIVEDIIVGEKKTGNDFSFSVNRNLFFDIFKNLDSENVMIKYRGESLPIEYNDLNNSNGVIMPLRKN